jgi:hypothetical protein
VNPDEDDLPQPYDDAERFFYEQEQLRADPAFEPWLDSLELQPEHTPWT